VPLIPTLIAFAVVLGYLLGGRLSGFEHLRINRWGLAIVGLVLQLVPSFSIGDAPASTTGPVVLALSYTFLVVFLFSNRWIPGMPVMRIGLLLNLVVVLINGGMPVQAAAIQRAGGDPATLAQEAPTKHHLTTDEDVLWQLGDVIPIPPPFSDVVSIGDVLLYGGMVYSIVEIMRGRRRENPRPLAWWFPGYRGKHAPDWWRMPVRYRTPGRAEAGRSGTEP
jgi:Family of unknown function (DUF5317)